MKRLVALLLLITICLSGCIGAAFVAGAATGGLIVYDRRTVQSIALDQKINYRLIRRLCNNPEFAHSHIIVSSFNQIVLLAGQTPLASLRAQAEKTAYSIEGVKKVYNEITIGMPTSTMTQSMDAWITTKVKAKLIATEGLSSSQIKVITEDGTVYLIGIVEREQANLAVDIARRVDGVKRIVRVFNYIS